MPIEVFSEEWSRAYCEALNRHQPYGRAAEGWEGAVVLVMRRDPAQGIEEDRAVFLDLRHGGCRGARVATEDDLRDALYRLSADPTTWRQILAQKLDPISALMQGKLRLERGSLMTMTHYAPAARELVVAATQVEAVFPGGPS